MRFIVLGAAVLLAGCVQQSYAPPPPIQLQPMGPAIPYSTGPGYRSPMPAPGSPPSPDLDPISGANAPMPGDDSRAIPVQDMPSPVSEPSTSPTSLATPAAAIPTDASPAPPIARTPMVGPGSNVPLEGFRPMRGQTRPTP